MVFKLQSYKYEFTVAVIYIIFPTIIIDKMTNQKGYRWAQLGGTL